MPTCKNDSQRRYTGKEPSPKGLGYCAHAMKLGSRKKGLDGNTWIVKKISRGQKKWQRLIIAQNSGSKTSKQNSGSKTSKQHSGSKTSKQHSGSNKFVPKSAPKSVPKKKLNRKAPSDSATIHPIGYSKEDKEGNKWIIKQTSLGVKRWVRLTTRSLGIKHHNNHIISFDASSMIKNLKKGNPKKIGTLNITSNQIGVGETIINKIDTKKGKYNIYIYDFSLIAIHENEEIIDQKFKIIREQVLSDGGMFSYCDYVSLIPYFGKGKKFYRIDKMPYSKIYSRKSNNPHKIDKYDAYYLYENDLDKAVPRDKPIAIFAGNGYGDGSFDIFKGRNAFWIMSEPLQSTIFELMGIKRANID